MLRQYLAYLLTALIALQSVVAVADAHQFHQSGTEHLTFEHEHDQLIDNPQAEREIKINDLVGSPSLDCHHCCHCHGMAHFFLGSSQNSLPIINAGSSLPGYQFHYFSYQGSPDNPPPIN